MLGPVCAQVVRQAEVPASDRKFPALTDRSGTQRARRLWSRTAFDTSAPWSSSSPSDLRITRVFSCVARGFKGHPSFMFAGLLLVAAAAGICARPPAPCRGWPASGPGRLRLALVSDRSVRRGLRDQA